jgi:hypothetical protein
MTRDLCDLFTPPAIVRPAADLAALAREINTEHEAIESAAISALEHARRAGEKLLEARAKCPHGTWLSWLKTHVRFSRQSADGYMRVAKEFDKLPTVGNLGLREALAILSTKPEPETPKDLFDIADEQQPVQDDGPAAQPMAQGEPVATEDGVAGDGHRSQLARSEPEEARRRADEVADVFAGFHALEQSPPDSVVANGSPELVEAMDQGKVSVAAAAEVATLPKAEQRETVAGGPEAVKAKAKEARSRPKANKPASAKERRLQQQEAAEKW